MWNEIKKTNIHKYRSKIFFVCLIVCIFFNKDLTPDVIEISITHLQMFYTLVSSLLNKSIDTRNALRLTKLRQGCLNCLTYRLTFQMCTSFYPFFNDLHSEWFINIILSVTVICVVTWRWGMLETAVKILT